MNQSIRLVSPYAPPPAQPQEAPVTQRRISESSFSNGRDAAPAEAYRARPRPQPGALQSRYVGPYLLYGAGAGWGRAPRTLNSQVYAVRYADAAGAQQLRTASPAGRSLKCSG